MRFKNDPVRDGILCVTGNLIFFSMVCDPGSQNEVTGTGEVILIHHHHLFIHLILRTKKKKKTSLKPQAQMEERVHFLSRLWGTMSSFANVKMMKLYATDCCFPNSLLYLISQNLDHLGISSTFPFVHSVTMPYDNRPAFELSCFTNIVYMLSIASTN